MRLRFNARLWCLFTGFFLAGITGAQGGQDPRYFRYLNDTLASMECLRGHSGLIDDRISLPTSRQNCGFNTDPFSFTTPTNIALDILAQLEADQVPTLHDRAWRNLTRILEVLAKLDRHPGNGLYFSAYFTGREVSADKREISSVDNIHLALALWTLWQGFPETEAGTRAGELFRGMDFSVFYDPRDGLLYGAMRNRGTGWVLESWKYRYFGSESRTIYSVGWALGLFKDPDFLNKTFHSLTADVFTWTDPQGQSRKLLGLWDGGAFQLLLPKLLVSEDLYSGELGEMFRNYAAYLITEGHRRRLPVPAAHSASQIGDDTGKGCGEFSCYNGKAGNLALVALSNKDQRDSRLRSNWETVFTPHALVMAAAIQPGLYADSMTAAEALASAQDTLYSPGLGWLDGYWVESPRKGEVVPVFLSLDQGMIALAAAQVLAPDHLDASARALHDNRVTRKRLQEFYLGVDLFLNHITGTLPTGPVQAAGIGN